VGNIFSLESSRNIYLDKMTLDNNRTAVSQSGTKAVAPKQQKLAKHSAKV